MAGIKFLSDNYVDESTISITTGSENAQFPLTNLQNESPSVKFRSTGNTAVIVIDLLTTRAIDSIGVVGDPTSTFGVTQVDAKTSVTTDFSGSPNINIPLNAEQNIGYVFITPVTHRYVQLTLTGTGSFSELGAVFVGEAISLTQQNLSTGSFRYGYTDRSRVEQNKYGQKFIDKRNQQKDISGRIEFATKDEQETLDDMFIFHSTNKPLWIIVDENSDGLNEGQYKLTLYGYLSEHPDWSASGGQTYNTSITMNEAI